jgi:uncharacterized protein YbjT (DUF2867 family)
VTIIAIAGGTGALGAQVVEAVRRRDLTAVVIARSHGVDLTTGAGPVGMVPKMLSQPVSARELADLLIDVAVGEPVGLAADVAGPEQLLMPDLARRLVLHRGHWAKVVAAPIPGKAGRQIAEGGLLPGEGATILPTTYDDWLAAP